MWAVTLADSGKRWHWPAAGIAYLRHVTTERIFSEHRRTESRMKRTPHTGLEMALALEITLRQIWAASLSATVLPALSRVPRKAASHATWETQSPGSC